MISLFEPSAAKEPQSLFDLLEAMNLGRYHPRLQEEKLDLKLFFSLTEKVTYMIADR